MIDKFDMNDYQNFKDKVANSKRRKRRLIIGVVGIIIFIGVMIFTMTVYGNFLKKKKEEEAKVRIMQEETVRMMQEEKARADPELCLWIRAAIHDAIIDWAEESHKPASTPVENFPSPDLLYRAGYLKVEPKCPSGGMYIYVGRDLTFFDVRCSIHGTIGESVGLPQWLLKPPLSP